MVVYVAVALSSPIVLKGVRSPLKWRVICTVPTTDTTPVHTDPCPKAYPFTCHKRLPYEDALLLFVPQLIIHSPLADHATHRSKHRLNNKPKNQTVQSNACQPSILRGAFFRSVDCVLGTTLPIAWLYPSDPLKHATVKRKPYCNPGCVVVHCCYHRPNRKGW